MKTMVIAGVIGLTVSAFAVEKVWTGGAGDRKWSTSANWGGSSAPVSGDSVQITLASAITVTNDISGLSLSGLVISNTAAAGLDGQTITLAGAASIVAGASLTLTVPFDGTGAISRSGTGNLYLSGNNSGYAGAWTFTNGHTYVRHLLALGPSAPVTLYGNTASDTCSLRMDVAGAYANPMTFYKGSSQVYISYKVITNTAPISCYGQTRLMASSGSIYIQGGLISMDNGGVIFNSSGGNKIVLENTPPNLGTSQFYFDAGLVDLGVSGTWGNGMLIAKGTLRTLAENVLGTNGLVHIGTGYGLWGTLDMNGFSQLVKGVYSDTSSDSGGNPRRITSATPALLESLTTSTQTFNGTVDGAVSFRMSGTGRQNFDKGISTTSGEMVCARGQLGLSPDAQFTALSALVITNTGYMIVTSPSVNPNLIRVRIADTGRLDIGTGVQVEAFDAQVNGVYLAPGVYTQSTLSSLSGNGSLKVLTAGTVEPAGRFVWNGATADTFIRTAGNWVDGVAPAFNRKETLVFSDGTGTASLLGEIDVYALNFRTNANFTLSAGDSAAQINLGAGGLSLTNQVTSAVSYEIEPALNLQAPQLWQMHTNTASLTLRGAISGGYSNWNWIVSGPSALHLYGDNTFVSPLIVSNGCLRVYTDTALGSPTRPVTVIGESLKAFNHLFFDGPVRTNDVPLIVGSYIGDLCRSGETLVLNGSLSTTAGGGDAHIKIPGTVIARGGLDGTASRFWLQQPGGGTLIIENKPMVFGSNDVSQDDSGTICLNTTNNSWKTYNVYGGVLLCGTSNVLTSSFSFGATWKKSGTLNLNGFDQRLDALRSGTAADLSAKYCVTSPTPAVLTLTPATNTISFSGYFTGEAAFHHAASGTFTFDALPSTTKGALRVSNGTVGFTGGAGWLGSTNVIVSGTGTLRVQAASAGVAFGTVATGWETHLIMAESGKLQLDTGTGETVKFLQINGVEMPRGTYGATGSGAQVIDDVHFSGAGILTVRSQNIHGTILWLN